MAYIALVCRVKRGHDNDVARNFARTRHRAGRFALPVVASSTGAEVSFENSDWKHAAFTKALLEGLAGEADKMPRAA